MPARIDVEIALCAVSTNPVYSDFDLAKVVAGSHPFLWLVFGQYCLQLESVVVSCRLSSICLVSIWTVLSSA